jgi:hypothetical protein
VKNSWKLAWQSSDDTGLCGGEVKPDNGVEEEEKDVVMIGLVSCKVSSEIHIDGRCIAIAGQAKAVVPGDELGSSAQKRARANTVRGWEIVEPGYSTLKKFTSIRKSLVQSREVVSPAQSGVNAHLERSKARINPTQPGRGGHEPDVA